ncbi:MAG: carboxypeptidase-like regulatory domain-containing protein, partial [Cytophagaceae bacterium]
MTNRYTRVSSRRYLPWLLGLTLLFCSTVYGQGTRYTFTGRTTDATGQPLPGVTVQLTGTAAGLNGTASDANGNYSFNATVTPGTYTLMFTAVGYGVVNQTITLGRDETVTTNAQLKEDVANLDEVVVTGSTITTTRRELGNA